MRGYHGGVLSFFLSFGLLGCGVRITPQDICKGKGERVPASSAGLVPTRAKRSGFLSCKGPA